MISAELGSQLEAYVARLVESGRYNSKSEVLREGVRAIQERETRLNALDASIARGLADADRGRTKSAEQVFDRLEAKYDAMIPIPNKPRNEGHHFGATRARTRGDR